MERDLGRLADVEHDLLVVGGGIYGAACAWDAAQRGLKVALVEAADFASGASWNSLKTIHGGLRHLQRVDLLGVRESMLERRALLRIAGPLIRPLAFLVPTYGHGPKGPEAMRVGLALNDLITLDRNRGLPPQRHIPRGRVLSRAQVLAELPGLPAEGLSGAAVWHDAQVTSSERLVLGFLHSAASAGAVLANHLEVIDLLRDSSRVVGARVHDHEGGEDLDVRARMVLNAAGPGAVRVSALAQGTPPPVPLLRATNLVLRRPPDSPRAVGVPLGGRYFFLVPWLERTMVGTSYEPAGEPDEGAAAFLEEARRAFPWADLRDEDVSLVHRGDVPGRDGGSGLWTHHRLLDHEKEEGLPGLVSLFTVKYTTARGVAEQAIDLVAGRLRRRLAPCRTAQTPLSGLCLVQDSLEQRARFVAGREMARHLDDAVLRRLDLGTGGAPEGADLEVVLAAMAAELAWDPRRQEAERERLQRFYAAHSVAPPPQSG